MSSVSNRSVRQRKSLHHHRKYYRIHNQIVPQQIQTIIQFLQREGYEKTYQMFIKENRANKYQYNSQLLAKEIEKFRTMSKCSEREFMQLSKLISEMQGLSALQKLKFQFLSHIWLVSLNPSTPAPISKLKQFIQENGSSLAQITQVLSYFALPYISNPQQHPFLKCIFTKQWKEQYFTTLASGANSHKKPDGANQETQWLHIIKDLISICLELQPLVPHNSEKAKKLFKRVNQYQEVLKENKQKLTEQRPLNQQNSLHSSELNQLLVDSQIINLPSLKQSMIDRDTDQNDANDIELIKKSTERELIDELGGIHHTNQSLLKFGQIKWNILHNEIGIMQVAILIHKLGQRIHLAPDLQQKKDIIKLYISHDIFSLSECKKIPYWVSQLEGLKLCYQICLLGKGRKYLCGNQHFVNTICGTILEVKQQYFSNAQDCFQDQSQQELYIEEKMSICLGILQKISLSKLVFQQLLSKNWRVYECIITEFLPKFQILSQNQFTYALAVLMNFLLYSKGNHRCSKTLTSTPKSNCSHKSKISLMQLMIIIWQQTTLSRLQHTESLQSPNSQQLIQSLIFSIIYILLSLKHNRQIARQLKLKQLFTQFLNTFSREHYDSIIRMMMKRLDQQQNPKKRHKDIMDEAYIEGEDCSDDSSLDAAEEDDEDQQLQSVVEVGQVVWIGRQMIKKDAILDTWNKQFKSKYWVSHQSNSSQGKINHGGQQFSMKNKRNKEWAAQEPKHNVLAQFPRISSKKTNRNQNISYQQIVQPNFYGNYSSIQGYNPKKYVQWRNPQNSHIIV